MKKYSVEYRTAIGRIKAVRVMARNVDEAIEAAVSATGCNFSDVQSTEERD